jgi:hypothetical protein
MSRVLADLEAGRLWKARDRLQGLFSADPVNQDVLELLGETYFRMGDLPQAGRYWFLTARSGADVEAAGEAFDERFGVNAHGRAHSLPVRAAINEYPREARERLDGLIENLKQTDSGAPYRWMAHSSRTRWVTGETPGPRPSASVREPGRLGRVVGWLGMGLVAFATAGVWIVGLATVFWFIGTKLFG